MKFMLMAASLRQDSVNKKLIQLTAKLLQQQGHNIDLADFAEFDLPLYNADIQDQQGFPANVQAFIQRMHAAQGLIIASPEYNYSTPGTLKNLIDWVSRVSPMPWAKQNVYLMSASPSLVGGHRGLWHTRVPLEGCGAMVYPTMFALASAYEAFNEQGELKAAQLQQRLVQELASFADFAKKLS